MKGTATLDVRQRRRCCAPGCRRNRRSTGIWRELLGVSPAVRPDPRRQAAVWVDGEIRLSIAHGLADLATSTPLTAGICSGSHPIPRPSPRHWPCSWSRTARSAWTTPFGVLLPRIAAEPVADRRVRELLSHSAGLFRDGSGRRLLAAAAAIPGPRRTASKFSATHRRPCCRRTSGSSTRILD